MGSRGVQTLGHTDRGTAQSLTKYRRIRSKEDTDTGTHCPRSASYRMQENEELRGYRHLDTLIGGQVSLIQNRGEWGARGIQTQSAVFCYKSSLFPNVNWD